MRTDSVNLILRLKQKQGWGLETKAASRIKWSGNGELLVYGASDKVTDRVQMDAVEQLTIEFVAPTRVPAPFPVTRPAANALYAL
jgi:hypothetical protein